MLFGYLVIRILNSSYRPSGAAGDLHTRVWNICYMPSAPWSGSDFGRLVLQHVGCLGYTPELPDHEVLRR